jgi:hypothetical protein
MTLGSTLGILIGTAVGGPAGGVIGGLLGDATGDLAGDILTSLGGDAIVDAARSVRTRWSPAQHTTSETIQSIFRTAMCESLYDIGGSQTFPGEWRSIRPVSTSTVYWQIKYGQQILATNRELAEQAHNCLRALARAVEDQSLFALAKKQAEAPIPELTIQDTSASVGGFSALMSIIDQFLDDQFRSLRLELAPYQLEEHLHRELPNRIQIHFAELLRSRPDAWRDYQRLLLTVIRDAIAVLAIGQDALQGQVNRTLARLDAVLSRPDPTPVLMDMDAAIQALQSAVSQEGQEMRAALRTEVTKPVIEQITERIGVAQTQLSRNIQVLRPTIQVFVPKDVYFKPFLQPGRLFSHTEQLTGRGDVLELLLTHIKKGSKVIVLQGRGGIGKSRLLLEFVGRLEQQLPDSRPVFLAQGIQLTENNIGTLPENSHLLVADDAHQRTDLSMLYAYLHQRDIESQLVLASRPHAVDRIISDLLRAGFDTSQIAVLPPITELSRKDARTLAVRLLGEGADATADRLVAITHDSPLVMVLGARLLKERAIDPLLLERDTEFRTRLLQTFQDVLLGGLGNIVDVQLTSRLLPLIAAVAPFRARDSQLLQTAASLLATDVATLQRTIEELERAGVLLRRGRGVRITPDVLSDHILHRACITEQGELTGYAQTIYQVFMAICPGQVLTSLAELDWRVRQTSEQAVDVLGSIWVDLINQFHTASHEARCHMIDLMSDIAYHQPNRMFDLVQLALREPGQEEDSIGWRQFTHADVLQRLPRLLRYIAYTVRFLPRCYDLLWRLGMDDSRPTNQYPDHPMRVLVDLAGYDVEKPWIYQQTAVVAAKRWLQRADAHTHAHTPLEVLDALLVKTAVSDRSDGRQVYMTSFALTYAATRDIRQQAIDLIRQCAESTELKVVFRAIESLSTALRPPLPYFNMAITDDIRAEWHPEEVLVMDILAQIIERATQPVVQLRCIEALVWHTQYSSSETLRLRAREIIMSVPDRFELQLIKVIGSRYEPIWELDDSDDEESRFTRHEERRMLYCRAVATHIISNFNAEQVFSILVQQLEALQQVGIQSHPLDLLMTISDLSPTLAGQLCHLLIEQPSNHLTTYFAWLLRGIRKSDVPAAIELQQRALASRNDLLCFSQIHVYRWDIWLGSLQSADLEIVTGLLTYPEPAVSTAALGVLTAIGQAEPTFAVQAALAANIGEDTNRARELCGVFDKQHGVGVSLLSSEQRALVLEKLVPINNIGDYHIGMFLAGLSEQDADLVFHFFQRRIRYLIEHPELEYQAVPFEHSIPELVGLAGHPEARGYTHPPASLHSQHQSGFLCGYTA